MSDDRAIFYVDTISAELAKMLTVWIQEIGELKAENASLKAQIASISQKLESVEGIAELAYKNSTERLLEPENPIPLNGRKEYYSKLADG
jgi:cell division septum initiation protein DivIVA